MSKPKFAVGDLVTYVNVYGCKFPEHRITGIELVEEVEPHYYLDTDCHWVAKPESRLIADADDPVVTIVGGHKIRNTLVFDKPSFLVGTLHIAFPSLEEAEQYALNPY